MIIEFCLSAILYLRLWKTRNWWDKDATFVDDESGKGMDFEKETKNDSADDVSFFFFFSC